MRRKTGSIGVITNNFPSDLISIKLNDSTSHLPSITCSSFRNQERSLGGVIACTSKIVARFSPCTSFQDGKNRDATPVKLSRRALYE